MNSEAHNVMERKEGKKTTKHIYRMAKKTFQIHLLHLLSCLHFVHYLLLIFFFRLFSAKKRFNAYNEMSLSTGTEHTYIYLFILVELCQSLANFINKLN